MNTAGLQQLGQVVTVVAGLRQRHDEYECPEHGKYIGTTIFLGGKVCSGPVCPKCLNIRLEREAREEAEAQKAIKAQADARRLEAALFRSRIPEAYQSKTFDNFRAVTDNQAGALALAKRFVKGWERAEASGYGLLFYGNCGTGKSHLACAILKSLLPGVNGLYIRVGDLIRYIRSTWAKSSVLSDFEAIRQYVDIDLLVLDEVGVQAGTENEQQLLFAVIDARLAENRPTIFLTNLEPCELSRVLGERLVDRIREKCVPYKFAGKSQRRDLNAHVFGEAA